MIGREEIQDLEETIFLEFSKFRELFQSQKGTDVYQEYLESHPGALWSCFMSGRGKGLSLTGWDGAFQRWIQKYIPLSERRKVVPDAFHHVNLAVVDYGKSGGRKEGMYRLLVLFQEESDPAEIRLHTRSFYDLSAPLKVLLVWTDQEHSDPADLIREAGEVVRHCAEEEIPNHGTLALVVGDRSRLNGWLSSGTRPRRSLFQYGIVEPVEALEAV